MNERRQNHEKELNYLKGIRADLQANIRALDAYIANRKRIIELAKKMIEYSDSKKPLADLDQINEQCMEIYIWKKFFHTDNTFQAMMNSGNVELISSDSIRNMLFTLRTYYDEVETEEHHFRFDAETLLYRPWYELMDLDPQIKKYEYTKYDGRYGQNVSLSNAQFQRYLADTKFRNGFVMVDVEYSIINGILGKVKAMSEQLARAINAELEMEKK
jgi:hypothetical protein